MGYPWSHSSSDKSAVLIANARLLDGSGGPPIDRADILIEGGVFTRISAGEIEPSAGALTLDAKGKTVIPGLIDMHAHLISGGFDTVSEKSMSYDLLDQRRALMQMLYWGVTAVYSPVQPLKAGLELREEVRQNAFPSPRLFISGPGFTASQGWAGSMDPAARLEPRDAAEAADQVAELAEAGIDIIKIFYDDMDSAFCTPLPKLSKPLMEAVIDQAHLSKRRVMVHVYDTDGHKDAINAGADIMAHSAITAPVDEEYLARATKQKTLYLSTLCVYNDVFDENVIREYISRDFVRRSVPEKTLNTLVSEQPLDGFEQSIKQSNIKRLMPTIQANLRAVFHSGVPIGIGPDTGVPGAFPGLAVHREMELMAEAGIPEMALLTAATRTGAQYLDRDDLGVIEEGRVADAVIIDEDPLDDIRNTRKIHTVIKDGVVVDREGLLGIIMEPAR
jgi:imidazolonepropionase-like amidohydrolase